MMTLAMTLIFNMKKILFVVLLAISTALAHSQVPTDTTDLRAKINSWVVTNGSKQITALQINQLFNGVANLMKAYAIDSGYRVADTLFLTRRNGFTTIRVTLNTGGAPSETDPTVPTVAKALTGADTTRWNNKQNALTPGSGISIIANVISADNTTAQWNANKLQGNNLSNATPLTGQVLKWNGSTWAPDDGASNLEDVTNHGNKTSNSVGVKGMATPSINSDTVSTEAAFEFLVFPDLQGMTAYYPDTIRRLAQWVVSNKVSENIKAVLTVGDLCQTASAQEFMRVDTLFKRIDSLGIPYLPILGNHDYNGGTTNGGNRASTDFNSWFGPSRFAGKPWYSGNQNGTNDNYYIKFDVGSYKFLVLGLELYPRDSILQWAQGICDANPDRKVIMCTHAYINDFGEKSRDTSIHGPNIYGLTGNAGQDMWDKFVKKNANIVMVLGGHFGVSLFNQPGLKRTIEAGEKGNIVNQIFVNYQNDGINDYVDNGNGYFMKLRFEPSTGKVYSSMYSVVFNAYDSRVDSFTVDVPGLKVNTSLGVMADINVDRDVSVGNKLFLRGNWVPRYSILYDAEAGEVKGDQALTYLNGLFKTPNATVSDLLGSGNVVYTGPNGRLKTNSIFTYDEATNRIGVNTSAPVSSVDIHGSFGATTVGCYPSGYYNNTPASFRVASAGGDYGFVINRIQGGTNRAATQVFYKSNSDDCSVLSPLVAGNDIGRISYMGPNGSSVVKEAGEFVCSVESVDANMVHGRFLWATGSTIEYFNDLNSIKMLLTTDGNLQVSKAPTNTGHKLWVNGDVASNPDSTPIVTSVGTERVLVQDATSGQYKGITPANINIGIGGSSTLDFSNTVAGTSSDLTITVTGAALGDLVVLGIDNASVSANSSYTAWVSATNTVTVRFNNYSSGSIDPSSGTFKVRIIK